MDTKPRVLIVGAGFAGLYATKALKNAAVEVLMIDQNNYHTFQPLLYQVATGGIDVGDIAQHVRSVFRRQNNFQFRQGTVVEVDWDGRAVVLADGERVAYDYLILGVGAVYNDFGVPGVVEHSLMLKSLTEAANIRSHVLAQFERASAHPELTNEGILNFVIVGAGPTGVEMAGALVELFDRPLKSDFPKLNVSQAKVIVLEMTDKVLAPYSERSRKYAANVLRRRGVDLRLNTTVAEVRADEVELKSGETIPTRTLIWAAGIRASPLVEKLGLELDRGYRVKVNEDLSVPGLPSVFVVGDMAGAKDEDGNLYPQVAQVAIQEGKHAAKQILADLGRTKREPFRYFDKGIMAIIGRNEGIAELSKKFLGIKMRGFLGWLGWLFIHLIYLPGYQNRFSAFANWTYNYFTFDRHARLITFMEPSPTAIANHEDKLISPEPAEPVVREVGA